jgi:hypothetical protein
MVFDGTSQYIDSENVLLSTTDGTQPYSFVIVFQVHDTNPGTIISQYISGTNRFFIDVATLRFRYFKNDSYIQSSAIVKTNTMYHCVWIRRTNGVVNLYVNGKLQTLIGTAIDNNTMNVNTFDVLQNIALMDDNRYTRGTQ